MGRRVSAPLRPRRRRALSELEAADAIVSKAVLLCTSAATLIAAPAVGGAETLVLCLCSYGGALAGYALGRGEGRR